MDQNREPYRYKIQSFCLCGWHLLKGRFTQLEEDGIDGDMMRAFLEIFGAQDDYY